MRFLPVIGFLLLIGCASEPDVNELKQEVLNADRNFSKMSEEKGIAAAFIYYADEKVIKPSEGKQPLVGKFALMEHYKKNPPGDETLTWEPKKVEVSGELGYTFGSYTLKTKTRDSLRDTTLYGNYVSIWKRKKDGSWRYVLDTGNSTPGPLELK